MLFQTPYLRLGTISAFGSAMLIIISFFFSTKSFVIHITREGEAAAVFAIQILLLALLKGHFPSYMRPFQMYLLLFVLLSGFKLRPEEHTFLKKTFILASIFYSILIIRSCASLAGIRYTHGAIVLFNTEFDPNFIAIPLVAALSLLFDTIVNEKKRILAIGGYAVVATAILLTASRGAFLGVAVTFVCFFVFYLASREVSLGRKAGIFLLFIAGLFLIAYIAAAYFPQQFDRMINFNTGADNGRLALWMSSLELWMEHPIFGAGLDGMYLRNGLASHNTYLQVLSETGVVGFICCSFIMVHLVKKCFLYDKSLFVLCCGTLVQIMFLSALSDRCFWIILIWLVMLPEHRRQKADQNEQSV